MPLNETPRRPRRERWPLAFDLEGVPRDQATRKRELEERVQPEIELRQKITAVLEDDVSSQPTNSFVVDKLSREKQILLNQILESYQNGGAGREIDLSKPPIIPYVRRDFPQLVYHHQDGRVIEVADEKQLKAALKAGFQAKPSPDHDYSKIRAGAAPRKEQAIRPKATTAADLLGPEDEDESEEAAS